MASRTPFFFLKVKHYPMRIAGKCTTLSRLLKMALQSQVEWNSIVSSTLLNPLLKPTGFLAAEDNVVGVHFFEGQIVFIAY